MGHRAELLFTELRNALNQILGKRPLAGTQDGGKKAPESSHQIAELEEMLQKEREDFEVVHLNPTPIPPAPSYSKSTQHYEIFISFFIC